MDERDDMMFKERRNASNHIYPSNYNDIHLRITYIIYIYIYHVHFHIYLRDIPGKGRVYRVN